MGVQAKTKTKQFWNLCQNEYQLGSSKILNIFSYHKQLVIPSDSPCHRDSAVKRKIKTSYRCVYTVKDYVELNISPRKSNKCLAFGIDQRIWLILNIGGPVSIYTNSMVSWDSLKGISEIVQNRIYGYICYYYIFAGLLIFKIILFIQKFTRAVMLQGISYMASVSLRTSRSGNLVFPKESLYPGEEEKRDFYDEIYSWLSSENEFGEGDNHTDFTILTNILVIVLQQTFKNTVNKVET